ncbi:MAG: LD-carboxypeptidase [Bdellovibrionales bacterium]|nr:LD-carboxypeptidase [Bdellovibrionales bacterium]
MNTKPMIWRPLQPNDSVEIIAPASASTEDKFTNGLQWLEKNQLLPRYPLNMVQTDLFFAAPLEQQWEHFKEALYSDAKVIWCLRGGYGSMRLIPLLEKLVPPKNPKLLIGFSDITALHIFFNQKWNWPTLHGRTISQLHPDWDLTHEHQGLLDLIFGKVKQVSFNDLQPLNQAASETGIINSTIVGGNLRLIQSSLGTPWEIKAKGKMLFIEDVSERGYSIDRMLEQLHQAKIIDQEIAALLIGDFTEGLEKNGQSLIHDAIRRFAQRVNYPVLMGLPCGHAKGSNAALPFNTPAKLLIGQKCQLICQTNNT